MKHFLFTLMLIFSFAIAACNSPSESTVESIPAVDAVATEIVPTSTPNRPLPTLAPTEIVTSEPVPTLAPTEIVTSEPLPTTAPTEAVVEATLEPSPTTVPETVQPPPPADNILQPTDVMAVVVIADEANIYAAPNADSEILGSMAGGFSVPVDAVSNDGNWYHVTCPDEQSPMACDQWILADASIVQPTDPPPAQPTPES